MGYTFTPDDVSFLTSPAGADALVAAAELPLTAASRLADVAAVRALVGPRRAGAVLETAVLRRRAASKLSAPQRWLLTDEALQQATPSPVAAHRAGRLVDRDVHDVTCSVGADLVEVAAVARRAVGSDLDPVRLAMARENLRGAASVLRADALVSVVRADALASVSRGAVVLADPARRDAAGRRRWRQQDFAPPLGELASVHRRRDLVVKTAPGLDPASVPWAAEVELVSLDGDVREACLWSAGLATPGVGRRASVLSSRGRPPWTVTDAEDDTCPVRDVGEWIVDPDDAVVRAGLVRQYAARHGLGQLDPRIAYLTGDVPPPGVRAFRVLAHGTYTEKALRAELARRGVGRLEILVRGLAVDPNRLRPRLRLRGVREVTVVLTRIGRAPTAYLCAPVPVMCPGPRAGGRSGGGG